MNYFAHALPFLDDPYFAAGTGVPDWLSVVDRGCRVRVKRAEPFVADPDPCTSAVARGVIQHLRDDARFHETRAFAELSLDFTVACREALGGESGYRPAFLGHLLVEVLLDAGLIAENPKGLERYFDVLESVDAEAVQASVDRMASRPTDRLAGMIAAFREHRILWDYLEDGKLLRRLNQVMRRLGFTPLPEEFRDELAGFRRQVDQRRPELLDNVPAAGYRRP
jgi:hypothetical protein